MTDKEKRTVIIDSVGQKAEEAFKKCFTGRVDLLESEIVKGYLATISCCKYIEGVRNFIIGYAPNVKMNSSYFSKEEAKSISGAMMSYYSTLCREMGVDNEFSRENSRSRF